ncbi:MULTISPECIES: leucyl aminopeptidase family protein [unclassified Devosia]|uniref:leucyl aminopeptidase family protein n=1 Tax=unclassified Devosia TaxID=196773 RepID=UPI0015577F58|nr:MULTISPECIES: leucyl aminopeptidase family protein [unclassified Devosia]
MTTTQPIAIICLAPGGLDGAGLNPTMLAWAQANAFDGEHGRLLPVPGENGALGAYLFGLGEAGDRSPMVLGLAGAKLAPGDYRLAGAFGDPTLAAVAFRLGAYRFARYKKGKPAPQLALPEGADPAEVERLVEAATLARDWINTPANDFGPEEFERQIRTFAQERGMSVAATVGEDLLAAGFPLIHAVGRAGHQPPRLLDLSWGDPSHPKVTLVGKGVTFDTGGLDIKNAAGMLLMKKDMGGAANILGLTHAIVSAKLGLRLRVLIPIVENAIASAAFRPGDVLPSRKGLTVEIGNTDAEGRLILADALALADEESPELLLDMATLTGAARVALGPELPALFSTDDALARELMTAGLALDDPLWQMPLWSPYDAMMNSKIADVNNAGQGGFAGSITAALFMRRFVANAGAWVHLDIMAWAPEARAGRPFGATDHGIRAVYGVLKARYPRAAS